jgi:hypothetical protein
MLGVDVESRLQKLDQPREQLSVVRLEHGLGRAHGVAFEHSASQQHRISPPHWPPRTDVLQHRPPKREKLVPE